jgi:uncharacterized protein (TIGR03437 family)
VWTDPHNDVYSVSVAPGILTVGGSLFVKDITQGGGLLPAGTVVRIDGAGFDLGTTLSADGVAMSPVRFVSTQQMQFTLMGAIELAGKHFHLRNSAGEETDFFASPPSAPEGIDPQGPNPHVIIPWRTQTTQALGYSSGIARQFIGLLNQTTQPVDVRVLTAGVVPISSTLTTIPPGKIVFMDVKPDVTSGTLFISPVPIRMIQYADRPLGNPRVLVTQRPADGAPSPVTVSTPPSIEWNWQIGAPGPVRQTFRIGTQPASAGFTATVSGGDWLTVSPTQGTTSATVSATVSPGSLGPGTYTAFITVTPIVPASLAGFPAQPSVIPVTLNVFDQPRLFAIAGSSAFTVLNGQLTPPLRVSISSNGNPIPFTAKASTTSGANWLSVSPSSATTPAQLTFAADPTGLGPGDYAGALTIEGGGNTLSVPVSLRIFPAVLPIKVNGVLLPFVCEAGAPEPLGGSQFFSAQPATGSVTTSVHTDTGGDWLHTPSVFPDGQSVGVIVSITPSSLAPGTYQGTVTVTSSVNGSAQVPVTLTVIPKPAKPPTVTLSSITITTPVGIASDPQFITLQSPEGPALYNVTMDAPYVGLLADSLRTPATFKVTSTVSVPGVYYANITFSTSGGSVTIPATVNAIASSAFPPVLGATVNAASERSGAITPGEIIAVFGSGVGPAPAGLTLDAQGKVARTLSNTQLLINGIPAPLTYASVDQLNAVVPYEIGTSGTATIQVMSNGQKSETWEVPLAASASAIFTLNATGVGSGAVLNQDNSVNSPSNPASRGTFVQVYATGEGVLSPPGVTGSVTQLDDSKKPVLRVTATIGGIDAPVQFAGSAPTLVAGVLAVNIVIPLDVTPGSAVPVSIKIGDVQSPDVKMAVQ